FADEPLSLGFIDGMHLFDYVLRDFVHVERACAWHSVIVIDDVMPRYVEEAARDRITRDWTGDVYKLSLALAEHRPDLVLLPVNTQPTGLLVVLNPNALDTTLSDQMQSILASYDWADPQPVPDALLNRTRALDPGKLLDLDLFASIRHARATTETEADGRQRNLLFIDEN